MKFNIQSKLLFTHLQAVSKVVNSKNTISILDNFLFNLSGNTLVITASDQETTLTTQVEVANADSITLSSYMFGGAGMEPAALGVALAQAVNTVSAPVEGNQGVLVVKTTAKMKAPDAAPMNLKTEKQNLLQRYGYAAYQALNILERKADIKDNRGMFY